MSVLIPLDAVPNQSLSIHLDGQRYEMRFRDIGGLMSVDMTINETNILTGHRVVSGMPLIPYKYLENSGGNFVFLTELGDYPFWEQFGGTQSLIYLTVSELEAIRVS